MIETFVKRHVTTLMFVLFLVILGIVALGMLNVEEDPEIDFPMVSVNVVYPGASPATGGNKSGTSKHRWSD